MILYEKTGESAGFFGHAHSEYFFDFQVWPSVSSFWQWLLWSKKGKWKQVKVQLVSYL